MKWNIPTSLLAPLAQVLLNTYLTEKECLDLGVWTWCNLSRMVELTPCWFPLILVDGTSDFHKNYFAEIAHLAIFVSFLACNIHCCFPLLFEKRWRGLPFMLMFANYIRSFTQLSTRGALRRMWKDICSRLKDKLKINSVIS